MLNFHLLYLIIKYFYKVFAIVTIDYLESFKDVYNISDKEFNGVYRVQY